MAKKLPTRKVRGPTRTKKKAPTRSNPVVSSGISLPQKPHEPPKNLEDYTTLLCGKKGVGKTSLCAQFPNATIFQFEPGRRSVRCKQIPKPGEEPLTWDRFLQYKDLIVDKQIRVVVDTIDRAWAACVKFMLRRWDIPAVKVLKGYDPSTFWFEAHQELSETLEALLLSGCPLMFISHYKKTVVKPRDGDSFHEWEPACGAAWDDMKVICDIVLFYTYRRAERAMTVRGTQLVYASPGPEGHFQDPDGNLLIEVPLSNRSAKEAYKDLQAAYNNKLYGFIDDPDDEGEDEEDDIGEDD